MCRYRINCHISSWRNLANSLKCSVHMLSHGHKHLTGKDSYPLSVDESLDFLARKQFTTTLDLACGYGQVQRNPDQKQPLYHIVVSSSSMYSPLGSAMHQRHFKDSWTLSSLVSFTKCAVYLDNIVVASPTFQQHLADLKEALKRLNHWSVSEV